MLAPSPPVSWPPFDMLDMIRAQGHLTDLELFAELCQRGRIAEFNQEAPSNHDCGKCDTSPGGKKGGRKWL